MSKAATTSSAKFNALRERSRFTFRLIHLLAAMAILGVCFALYRQWGIWGLPWAVGLGGGAAVLAAWQYGLAKWDLVAVWVVLFILAGLLLPASSPHGPESPRPFRELRTAFKDYQTVEGALPQHSSSSSNGQPKYSWRATLLDYTGLPVQLDRTQGWDHPKNATATYEAGPFFRCGLESRSSRTHTSYVAITGPETCWPEERISVDDIADGAGNTILIVDSHRTGITWSEPRDLVSSELNWQINGGPNSINAGHGAGVQYLDGSKRPTGPRHTHAVMADGSVRHLSENMEPEVLKQLVNRRDGREKLGRK